MLKPTCSDESSFGKDIPIINFNCALSSRCGNTSRIYLYKLSEFNIIWFGRERKQKNKKISLSEDNGI